MGLARNQKACDRIEILFASILVAIDEDDATQFWVKLDKRQTFETPQVLITIDVLLDKIYLPDGDI